MKVVKTIKEVRENVKTWKKEGQTVGFVPTMGYLHEGHGSLIKKAREENDKVVAYCRIVPKEIGYDYTSIGRVLVLSSYRRKGIAQEMIKVALDFIKNNLNENIVVLSGQLYAKGLYESVGFNVISDVYDEVNIPHVKMKIEL